MRRALQSVGMKIFVEFYAHFKSSRRAEAILLLLQNGDVKAGAQTQCSNAKYIFENE